MELEGLSDLEQTYTNKIILSDIANYIDNMSETDTSNTAAALVLFTASALDQVICCSFAKVDHQRQLSRENSSLQR